MFFWKKQHKTLSPRSIGLLVLLLLANVIYISFFGSENPQSFTLQCDNGPLVSIDSCKEDRSIATAKGGWWFSDAFGALDKKVCNQMSLEEEMLTISIPRSNETDIVYKSSCKAIGLTDDNFCYASQHLSDDVPMTRDVRILTTNSHCGEARYFRGRNATLFKHFIKPNLNPTEVIADMPEIKK